MSCTCIEIHSMCAEPLEKLQKAQQAVSMICNKAHASHKDLASASQLKMIGDCGIIALSEALIKGRLAKLNLLNIGHNNIGDNGIPAIASSMASGGSRS